jgi:hypothetical protein
MKERRAGAWTPQAPSPYQPSGAPPAAEPPLPVQHIHPELIETQARTLLDQDQTARSLLQRGMEIRNEWAELRGDAKAGVAGKIPALTHEIDRIQAQLDLPEVKEDSLKVQDLNMKLIQKQGELLRHENRAQSLKLDYNDVSARYRDRHAEATDYVRGQHQQAYDEYSSQQQEQAEFNDAADTIIRVWPGAVQRAVAEFKIGADQVPDFQTYAKLHANNAPDEIEDIEGFVRARAQEFAAISDRAHRARSAAFGQMATNRANAMVGVPPGNGQAPAPAAPNQPPTFSSDPLRDVQRNVELKWAQFASGR